jgi:hypothetical protein
LGAPIHLIVRNKTPDTFPLANWADYQKQGGDDEFRKAMLRTLESLKKTGTRAWVVMPHPTYDQNVPKTLILNSWYPSLFPALRTINWHEHQRRNPFFMNIGNLPENSEMLNPS